MRLRAIASAVLVSAVISGCGDSNPERRDGGDVGVGKNDGLTTVDSLARDAGRGDKGLDGGSEDVAQPDARPGDSGPPDVRPVDLGLPDADLSDTGGCIGDLFTDLFGDGSLRLSGADTFTSETDTFSFVCNTDSAHLAVCDGARLTITGGKPSSVGGEGLTPIASFSSMELQAAGTEALFIVVTVTSGQVLRVRLDSAHAPITFAVRDAGTLQLQGSVGELNIASGSVVVPFGATLNVQKLSVSTSAFFTANGTLTGLSSLCSGHCYEGPTTPPACV